ncbi:olfactory receptor 2T1-like [Malaclemys terrapin pileata]|uniref:olfactory receptor 2T1-like n=1 Tax=Malaclemys terrapin pileata TaxID=2991368 RepID=UPI0023A7FA05|nr:olfactory receptor 2T1-like [Malaclemys terrapin pileata]
MEAKSNEEEAERNNTTFPTEFILLGLFNQTETHTFLVAMILLAFITALSGNGLLIFLIQTDSSLHSPMYFFLSQLAFMDICQILIVVPKMAMDFLIPGNPISIVGCGTQIFLTMTMGGAVCLLLAVMSYDRYVAICNPLQYHIRMKKRTCLSMAAGVWFGASLDALIHTVFILQLPYCSSKEINHFFCEIPALLKLSCSDTSTYEMVLFVSGIVLLLIPSLIILSSYTCILSSVLRMSSVKGKQKALATCSSHLTVVGLFYGAAIFMYMRPTSYHSLQQDKMVSMFYTIVTPVLNPLIYSLRNRDVLGSLRKLVGKCRVCQKL